MSPATLSTPAPAATPAVATPKPEEPALLISTTPSGRVRILTLNRPKSLNALSTTLSSTLFSALHSADTDPSIRCIILTATGRAFCAGADIKQLSQLTPTTAQKTHWLADWNATFARIRTPVIAGVNGYALGGGCELAMLCDIVYASEHASFALPEVSLGTIPGAGGTQRLVAAVGKSRAMEMILTGDRMAAAEAKERGLVSRIFAGDELLQGCVEVAERIGGMGKESVRMAKEAVTAGCAVDEKGLGVERGLYYLSFGSDEFKEGCAAFLEKRKPVF